MLKLIYCILIIRLLDTTQSCMSKLKAGGSVRGRRTDEEVSPKSKTKTSLHFSTPSHGGGEHWAALVVLLATISSETIGAP